MSRKDIKNSILEKQNKAEEQAALVRNALELSEDYVISCVHNYICYKFFLDPEEVWGLSLNKMALRSIEKALEMKIPIAGPTEKATTCGSAGSAAMKKDFGVEIPPAKLGFAKDTEEVGRLVYQSLERRSHGY
ncbi:MAG: hypothetical protein IJV59_07145 [Eubacterium sp.]|nr:hypothetical protein [Eubacterium sp.]